jgi:hypothetical protein
VKEFEQILVIDNGTFFNLTYIHDTLQVNFIDMY